MNSKSYTSCPDLIAGHFPDGLDVAAIDVLIAETDQPAPVERATSALLDGSAAERRRRRIERRALAAVVRSLPVRPTTNSHHFKEAS